MKPGSGRCEAGEGRLRHGRARRAAFRTRQVKAGCGLGEQGRGPAQPSEPGCGPGGAAAGERSGPMFPIRRSSKTENSIALHYNEVCKPVSVYELLISARFRREAQAWDAVPEQSWLLKLPRLYKPEILHKKRHGRKGGVHPFVTKPVATQKET